MGGIALAAAVGGTAATLVALAASSPPAVHLWLLHGLWLVACAAGLAFLPHVPAVLELALGVLLAEGSASVPGLRPAAGRLANAMVRGEGLGVWVSEQRLGSRVVAGAASLLFLPHVPAALELALGVSLAEERYRAWAAPRCQNEWCMLGNGK